VGTTASMTIIRLSSDFDGYVSTISAWSGIESTNHEATAPPSLRANTTYKRISFFAIFLDKIPVRHHHFSLFPRSGKLVRFLSCVEKLNRSVTLVLYITKIKAIIGSPLYILRGSFSWRQTPNFNDSSGTDLFTFLSTSIIKFI